MLHLGWRSQVKRARDCYVRLDSGDYSVDPSVIGTPGSTSPPPTRATGSCSPPPPTGSAASPTPTTGADSPQNWLGCVATN
ncbi:hypothetical protein ACFQ06_12690 [Tessaracoccus lubricantis]|uniref:Mu transposase domain-containing protein n=1 Tax=Tessaracoccus lubricantis TaxID=545543 RepID=UPI00364536B2